MAGYRRETREERAEIAEYRRRAAKATALALIPVHGLRPTAAALGIHPSTLGQWRERCERDYGFRMAVKRTAEELASKLEELTQLAVDRAIDRIDATESLRDLVYAATQATTTARLLRGDPTQITEQRSELTDEERAQRIAEIMKAARERAGE